jgi:hypothetical protein
MAWSIVEYGFKAIIQWRGFKLKLMGFLDNWLNGSVGLFSKGWFNALNYYCPIIV